MVLCSEKMGLISTDSISLRFGSLFLLSGILLARQSVIRSAKLSENGANVCQFKTDRKQLYQCCKGWSQVGVQCTKAICTEPCVNGTCTKPDNCTCNPGYHGKQCERDINCPLDKWGLHGCTNNCQCPKNATCSPRTGICTCPPGWTGSNCETCAYDHHGEKCQYLTECYNGGCAARHGKCICWDGYYGERCKYKCKQGTFGYNCSKTCSCPSNTLCSHINGICCQCYNNATCYPNGSCDCSSGWSGEKCDKPYRPFEKIQSNCSCFNQTVDLKPCQCRPNNNSSTPTTTDREDSFNRKLSYLAFLLVFFIPVCYLLYRCFRRRNIGCSEGRNEEQVGETTKFVEENIHNESNSEGPGHDQVKATSKRFSTIVTEGIKKDITWKNKSGMTLCSEQPQRLENSA